MSNDTQMMPAVTERPSGRHPVNVGHLVMGIAFLGFVGCWALVQADVVGNGNVRWLLPVPWVLGGLAGLLALGLSSRNRWSTRQVGWVEQPTAAAPTVSDIPATPGTPATPETPETPEEER